MERPDASKFYLCFLINLMSLVIDYNQSKFALSHSENALYNPSMWKD